MKVNTEAAMEVSVSCGLAAGLSTLSTFYSLKAPVIRSSVLIYILTETIFLVTLWVKGRGRRPSL